MKKLSLMIMMTVVLVGCDRKKATVVEPVNYNVHRTGTMSSVNNIYEYTISNHVYLAYHHGSIIHAEHCQCKQPKPNPPVITL